MRCVVIDAPPALEIIKRYVEKSPSLHLVEVFEDVAKADAYLKNEQIDLLIIDIQMALNASLDIMAPAGDNPIIIFTTSHKKLTAEGFELQAVDYVQKPVSYERFAKAVAKAEEYFKFRNTAPAEKEYLHVYSDYRLIKIDMSEIEFIESLEDYIRIHMTNGKPILSLMPLKRVLQKLPPEKFQRVHRSYIVAVGKIKGVSNKRVILAAATVPISDSYLDVVKKFKKL